MSSYGFEGQNFSHIFSRVRFQRGLLFGVIIVAALLAFEVFNYSTTDYALADLLGDLSFAGVRWATILAIAFCGIDFAGIARLFTPEQGADEPGEVWYLFGAWLLAATMNAMLTWWGISLAILNHETLGNAVIDRSTLLKVVPIFVAVLVWLIRVLIIGTFSVAGDRLFSQSTRQTMAPARQIPAAPVAHIPARSFNSRVASPTLAPRPASASLNSAATNPTSMGSYRPASKQASEPGENNTPYYESGHSRPEPTYHPVAMSAPTGSNRPAPKPTNNSQVRR